MLTLFKKFFEVVELKYLTDLCLKRYFSVFLSQGILKTSEKQEFSRKRNKYEFYSFFKYKRQEYNNNNII